MAVRKIAENIYAVGVVDWNVRAFHGNTYVTDRGTTYNAYLILDEKITLIDTVYGPFANELISNIKEIVDPSKIDYIIANHVETDHSGALPEVLKLCPRAKVYGTSKCKEGLEKYYQIPMDFQIVKTGDKLKIGKKTLTFVEAPMIHWPDSMFTYSIEDQILFPNDAFGHHLASNKTYTDEVDECALWDECSKYYANILWPLGTLIDKKINDVIKMNIPIKMIAPSHGLIWRQNPMQIVEKYLYWAKNSTTNKVIIFYETMWNSTEKMAKKILEGINSAGLEARLYDVTKVDRTTLINDLLEAKGFLAGSSTHDNEMLPSIAGFLYFLKGLKPKNRIAAAFGSFGWAGGATAKIENELKEAGVEIVLPSVQVRFAPTPEELQKCFEFGKAFAGIWGHNT
ncbi:MAG: flavodoxin domain-containing protein [Elusimicrobia bacterium]|nr:flavodoxin domain-containing protein [Elusimicrobiota bacterium]